MTLGDIIKKYREQNNISMGEFASNCALSKGYISMLENNINPRNNKPISPTLPSIAKIATGMGIELDSLLKMLDNEQPIQLLSTSEEFPTIEIISSQQKELNETYLQLSDHNQRKVLTYSKNLLSTQQMEDDVLAAHARTDVEQTPEGVQHDIDIMNDDSQWD